MITNKLEKFTFGKYRNRTIFWVMKNDPNYILWAYNNIPTVNFSSNILLQTKEFINQK